MKRATIFAVAAAVFLVAAWGERWITDDALINFRYLDQLLAGRGLVFNAGERVEGFSSPLFLILLLPLRALGVDPFAAVTGIGLAASLAELALLIALLARLPSPSWARGWPLFAALGAALFAHDRMARVWATGGLETAVQSALLTALLLQMARGRPAAWLCVLLALGRPEGAIYSLIYLGALLVRGRRDELWGALNLLLPAAALILGARYLYYKDFVANPYHAKIAGNSIHSFGIQYAKHFLYRIGAWGWPAAAWLTILAIGWRTVENRLAFGLIVVHFAVVIAMGGDYMCDFRFFVPILGIVIFLISSAPAAARSRGAAMTAVAALLTVAVTQTLRAESPIFDDAPAAPEHRRNLVATRAQAERFRDALMRFAERHDALMVDRAGLYGWGHSYRTLDSTGLVSRELERDFMARDGFVEDGRRDLIPGHARWPRVGYLERERFVFIFPHLRNVPPSVPEVTAQSLQRHRDYPFLHVSITLGDGEYLRFFTTLGAREIAARARAHGVEACWRPPFGMLQCTKKEAAPPE